VLRLTGLNFGFFSESMRQWGTGTVIYPLLRVKDILASTGIVCVTTILAAIYPAFKAALIKPLDALHYQ
jgi:ABC-type lipoprotein release transport system permease subunit